MKTTRASKAAKTNAPPDPQTLALADPSSLQDPTQALLLEGSELALRVRLSPMPYRPMADGAHA